MEQWSDGVSADFVWPGRCLIEMKSRGEKLSRHYQQTFDYWLNLVPHRPPYVALCNFDVFWIYEIVCSPLLVR